MIDKIIGNKCTGCKMCGDICPTKAIEYPVNNEGFWYPKVDYSKCIKCNKCVNSCPIIVGEKRIKDSFEKPVVLSLYSKNENTRLSSTSGGVFFEFGKKIIDGGGYVIGSTYSDDWKSANHMIITDMNGLEKLKGSKYFQSDTANIYTQAQKALDTGKEVLFVGTPCQCGALKNFLPKVYKNLLIMDFICRGINSPLPFKKFIEYLEKNLDSKTEFVQLKNKKTGWQSLGTYVRMKNGKEYHQDKWHNDIWVRSFLEGNIYMRESCAKCKFRNLPHGTDLTIGDFWGITKQKNDDLFKGISVLMINSKKGMDFFNLVENSFIYKEHLLSEVIPGNPALVSNPPFANLRGRNKFFKILHKKDFRVAANAILESPYKKFKRSCGRKYHKIGKSIKTLLIRFKKARKIDIVNYIKFNYFSKNIIRDKGTYLIPYRNAKIDIDKTAKIIIKGKSIMVGTNKINKAKSETFVRMGKFSKWVSKNGADLFYGTTLEIKSNALFESGYFGMNTGSTIIATKEISFGDEVMMGRNVIIYDSNFHNTYKHGFLKICNKKVTVGNHVWLTNNITILKGSDIGDNCVISGYSTIGTEIPKNSFYIDGKIVDKKIEWEW